MKTFITVLFFTLLLLPINGIWADGKDLYWSDINQLTWKDYKKTADKRSKHKAHSAIGIIVQPSEKDDHTMIANVYTVFNKETSMKPNEDGQTTQALHHEQTRFDMAELYARIERKQLPDSTYKTIGRFYMIAQKINKMANRKFMADSKRYDQETQFGIDSAAQKKWDKNIEDSLGDYSDYTSDDAVELSIEKKITSEK